MATVSTRALSSSRPNDFLTISVDHAANDPNGDGKTGYYKVLINSVTWTGTGLAPDQSVTVDIRAPQFSGQNDTALVDNVSVASDVGSLTPAKTKQVLAVVGSNPGPSAFAQGDGTWDLLNIKTSVGSFTEVTNFVLTVDYTLTWHEVDSTDFGTLNSNSVSLHVDNDKEADVVGITSTVGTGYGLLVFLPVSVVTAIDDGDLAGDSVPNFNVASAATAGGYSFGFSILSHPISKSSNHTKSYPTKGAMVYAVNDGKIDGNGSSVTINNSGTVSHQNILGDASLYRVAEWPSDDTVDATFNYKTGTLTL